MDKEDWLRVSSKTVLYCWKSMSVFIICYSRQIKGGKSHCLRSVVSQEFPGFDKFKQSFKLFVDKLLHRANREHVSCFYPQNLLKII